MPANSPSSAGMSYGPVAFVVVAAPFVALDEECTALRGAARLRRRGDAHHPVEGASRLTIDFCLISESGFAAAPFAEIVPPIEGFLRDPPVRGLSRDRGIKPPSPIVGMAGRG